MKAGGLGTNYINYVTRTFLSCLGRSDPADMQGDRSVILTQPISTGALVTRLQGV